MNWRHDKLEDKLVKVEEGLNQIGGERLDQLKRMEVEIKELHVMKNCNTGDSGDHTNEVELKKLQKEMREVKVKTQRAVNSV
jgi:hypothetical protein